MGDVTIHKSVSALLAVEHKTSQILQETINYISQDYFPSSALDIFLTISWYSFPFVPLYSIHNIATTKISLSMQSYSTA